MRGGRRPLRIDRFMYSMDVLEMPSQHLVEDEQQGEAGGGAANGKLGRGSPSPTVTPAAMMLEQALAITEAAIVVYDVCSPASFQQARKLYDRLRQERGMGVNGVQNNENTKEKDAQDETRPKTSKRAVPKKKSMRFLSYKKEQHQQQQNQNQNQKEEAADSNHGRSISVGGARAKPARPFALLLVGTKSDADDSERCVAWIDGSKAAALPSPSTAVPPVPPVPPIPSLPAGLQPTPSHPPSSSPTFFVEASAKTGDNVTDVFVQIGREILRQRAERQRLRDEQEALQAQNAATDSGSSSTTTNTNTSLLRMKSQASATTTATRRTFGVLRVMFGRRPVVVPESQAVA